MHNTKHGLFNDYYVNLIDKFNSQKKLRKKMHCILPRCLKGETEKEISPNSRNLCCWPTKVATKLYFIKRKLAS